MGWRLNKSRQPSKSERPDKSGRSVVQVSLTIQKRLWLEIVKGFFVSNHFFNSPSFSADSPSYYDSQEWLCHFLRLDNYQLWNKP